MLNQPRYDGRHHPGGRAGLRHRLLARARRLGAAGLRLPAVIAPRFGDIFRNNATKAGLLPVVLPEKVVMALIRTRPRPTRRAEVTVDLDRARSASVQAAVWPRPRGAVRDRRLHPLAADGGPRRHRPDPAARGRHHRLRGPPLAVAALPASAVVAGRASVFSSEYGRSICSSSRFPELARHAGQYLAKVIV